MTETIEQNATHQHDAAEAPPKPRLLDQMREVIRVKHYSLRTEKTYIGWVKHFIRWSGMRHPKDMGAAEIEAFLSMLANQRDVAASTQNQALSALLFLYKQVLHVAQAAGSGRGQAGASGAGAGQRRRRGADHRAAADARIGGRGGSGARVHRWT